MTSNPASVGPAPDGLLPCPFCGNAPTVIPSGDGTGTMVECLTPGCVSPHVSYYGEGVAFRIWNTRAPHPDREAEPTGGVVAWRWRYKGTNWVYGTDMPVWASSDDCDEVIEPLYAAPQSEPLPGGVGEADYAAIGRGLVNAIEAAAAEYPWVRSWSPAERYDEIVGDLLDLAFSDTPVQSAVEEIRALETRTRPVDVIAAFLKERDDAVGTLDADDDERMESAQRILAALSGKEQG